MPEPPDDGKGTSMATAEHPDIARFRLLLAEPGKDLRAAVPEGLPERVCRALAAAAPRWEAEGLGKAPGVDGALYPSLVAGAFGFAGPVDLELYPGSDGVTVALYPYEADGPDHASWKLLANPDRVEISLPAGWDRDGFYAALSLLLADAMEG